MVDVDKLNCKFSEFYYVAGLCNIKLCVGKELMLFKLSLNKSYRKVCGVNRKIKIP